VSWKKVPQLAGYELLERLGAGARGTIHKARDRQTKRVVAIKHLVRRSAEDERFIAQAENELRVSQRVSHASIRRCYGVVRDRSWLRTRQLFLLMEYVEGRTLDHWRFGSWGELLEVFVSLARGLAAMHDAGYVHADIKPSNVLVVGGTREVKIIDLGQSCPIGHRKDRVQGTPDYMAPEQVLREPLDERTDVFNLGATMYSLLTGRVFETSMPGTPGTAGRIALQSRRGSRPPQEVNPDVPLALSRLVMACCAAGRESRPRTMAQVVSRLDLLRGRDRRGRRRSARHDREAGSRNHPWRGVAGASG